MKRRHWRGLWMAMAAGLAAAATAQEIGYVETFALAPDRVEALRELVNPPDPPPKQIGFSARERRAAYRAISRKRGQRP